MVRAVVEGVDTHRQARQLIREVIVHAPQIGFTEIAPCYSRLVGNDHEHEPCGLEMPQVRFYSRVER
jgi:hypothetical protein